MPLTGIKFKSKTDLFIILLIFLFWPGVIKAELYTVKAKINLRKGPGLNHEVIQKLNHNQSLKKEGKHEKWLKVRTQTGQIGYVHHEMVSDSWIKIHKKERKLFEELSSLNK